MADDEKAPSHHHRQHHSRAAGQARVLQLGTRTKNSLSRSVTNDLEHFFPWNQSDKDPRFHENITLNYIE
jgi:hypothetical protein